jgi:hypothetical protein
MKTKELTSTTIISIATLSLAALALSTPSLTVAREAEPPDVTHDGLVLVADRKVAAAYVDPDADFGIYNKIKILDCYVAFRKKWQRDQRLSQSTSRRVGAKDMEKIKADVTRMFREVFEEKLSKDGGYAIVEEPGDDVLLVRPAIIDLDVTVANATSTGRTSTYTSSSGAATLYVELYDSVTGDILARATDRKVARSTGGSLTWKSETINEVDARRALGRWANLLRQRLDEYHGKESS